MTLRGTGHTGGRTLRNRAECPAQGPGQGIYGEVRGNFSVTRNRYRINTPYRHRLVQPYYDTTRRRHNKADLFRGFLN